MVDPVTFEVVCGGLLGLAAEMKTSVMRNSYTPIVSSGGDLSVGIGDPEGRLVAQGRDIPVQLGTLPHALRVMVPFFPADLGPGDVLIANDPYLAGSLHVNDVIVMMPAFSPGDELLGFLVTCSHWLDVGSATPGSYDFSLREMYAEGLLIPPTQILRRHEPVQQVWDLIFRNMRNPADREWDFRAQIAGCITGERGLRRLATRYGVDVLHGVMGDALERGAHRMRRVLAALPDGDYRAVDWFEFIDQAKRLEVTLRLRGDELAFDWTGTDPAVDGASNSTLAVTAGMCVSTLIGTLDPGAPINAGVWEPLEITAPAGCIVNASPPSACATGPRLKFPDLVQMALAEITPAAVMGGSSGSMTSVINGPDLFEWRRKALKRERVLFVDQTLGGIGARATRDGFSVTSHGGNTRRSPIELLEFSAPVRMRHWARVPDTGGAGRQRGGCGVIREWEALVDNVQVTLNADRSAIPAFGLFGGRPGAPGRYAIIDTAGGERRLPAKYRGVLSSGERLVFQGPGGGGYGPPHERDASLVVDDYLDSAITLAGARNDYGVVMDADGNIDVAATKEARTALANQQHGNQETIDRGAWSFGSVTIEEEPDIDASPSSPKPTSRQKTAQPHATSDNRPPSL